MTFLNGLLAFGALAFTIPLAIHLLHRSRFTTVDWGAMHLLENVVRINRRRMQLMNLLLLILRCLVPAILAFCLARPVLTGFQSMPGDAPESLVIVLDDSRSMSAGKVGEASRIQKAKAGLTSLLGEMSRRDEVLLLRSSHIDLPAGTMGVNDATQRLRDIKADGGPVDLGRMLDAAVEAANTASHQQRRILVVSDFQSQMLQDGAVETLERLSASIEKQDVKPVVGFWSFAEDTDQLSNVSVDAVAIDSPAVVAGRSTQYSARIQNASDTPVNDLRVTWSINGQALPPRTMSLSPRSFTTSRLNHVIEEPGAYEMTVSIEHGDSLLADNRRTITGNAMREVNVLLVDGQPSKEPLQGETDFLAIALSPFAFGGNDQPDAVRTDICSQYAIVRELEKSNPEIVILANTRFPREDIKQALAKFVLEGGSLIVFDGDNVRVNEMNETWKCEQGEVRLPAIAGERVGDPDDKDPNPMQIGERNPNFSAWDILSTRDEQPLSDVNVRAYRKLLLPEDADDRAESATVLLSMSSGDPLVVASKRGRGQIVQFAIPCDRAWTTLPLRPIYLPMMQQLVLDLAGKSNSKMVEVGQPMSIPVSEFDIATTDSGEDVSQDKKAKVTFSVQVAGGDELPVQSVEDGTPRLMWTQTNAAGTYRFRRTITTGDQQQTATTMRVAFVPSSESRLRDLPGEQLKAAAGTMDAKIHRSAEEILRDDRIRRFGREVWRWLLLALLVFLVAELFLQQHLVRARHTGAS